MKRSELEQLKRLLAALREDEIPSAADRHPTRQRPPLRVATGP